MEGWPSKGWVMEERSKLLVGVKIHLSKGNMEEWTITDAGGGF